MSHPLDTPIDILDEAIIAMTYDGYSDAAKAVVALREENAELRNALKPFAEEAKSWGDGGYRPVCCAHEFVNKKHLDDVLAAFTVEDLFRAAALLKETAK